MHVTDNRSMSVLFLLFSLPAFLLFFSCEKDPGAPIVRQGTAMNTYVGVSIYDSGTDRGIANAWIDSAFAEIKRVEGMATDYSDTSQVGRINALAGLDSVQTSPELIALVRLGLHYGKMSNGAFDIAIKPLVKVWDFLGATPHVPSKEEIQAKLPLIDDHLVSIAGDKVYLPRRGMGIDLGAYGKGYAIDRAVQLLRRAGYKELIVDIGGKLGIYWEGTQMLDSTAADVSIRHPRRSGEYLGSFRMGTGAVSTSGDYERFFIENGIRYHHLLDPTTGYSMRGIVSVTLVTPDATWADALSTIVFLLGRDKGMELIKKSPGVDGMIVYESADTLALDFTAGFRRRFVMAESHD